MSDTNMKNLNELIEYDNQRECEADAELEVELDCTAEIEINKQRLALKCLKNKLRMYYFINCQEERGQIYKKCSKPI